LLGLPTQSGSGDGEEERQRRRTVRDSAAAVEGEGCFGVVLEAQNTWTKYREECMEDER